MVRNLSRICAVVVLTCVPACAATEESPTQCTAKLPNGTTAELIGLRCFSGMLPAGFEGDKWQWWKPDGASLMEPPDKATTSTSYNDAYVLVLRVGGSPDCSCIAVGPWNKDTDSADLWLKGQRPSRNCVQRLAKERETLEKKGVSVVLVDISTAGDNPPEDWLEKNRIPLFTDTLDDGRAKARQIWGATVLPWLILTDGNHVITTEGFSLDELDQKLGAKGN